MHEEELADPVMALGVILLVVGIMYLLHGAMVVYRRRKRVLVSFHFGRLTLRTLLRGVAVIGGGIVLMVVGHWVLG